MDRTRNHMDIPIDEIDFDNLPSDEELEAMGPLKPINANREDFFDKMIFLNGRKLKKDDKDKNG